MDRPGCSWMGNGGAPPDHPDNPEPGDHDHEPDQQPAHINQPADHGQLLQQPDQQTAGDQRTAAVIALLQSILLQVVAAVRLLERVVVGLPAAQPRAAQPPAAIDVPLPPAAPTPPLPAPPAPGPPPAAPAAEDFFDHDPHPQPDEDVLNRCGVCTDDCQEAYVIDPCGHYPYCLACISRMSTGAAVDGHKGLKLRCPHCNTINNGTYLLQ